MIRLMVMMKSLINSNLQDLPLQGVWQYSQSHGRRIVASERQTRGERKRLTPTQFKRRLNMMHPKGKSPLSVAYSAIGVPCINTSIRTSTLLY